MVGLLFKEVSLATTLTHIQIAAWWHHFQKAWHLERKLDLTQPQLFRYSQLFSHDHLWKKILRSINPDIFCSHEIGILSSESINEIFGGRILGLGLIILQKFLSASYCWLGGEGSTGSGTGCDCCTYVCFEGAIYDQRQLSTCICSQASAKGQKLWPTLFLCKARNTHKKELITRWLIKTQSMLEAVTEFWDSGLWESGCCWKCSKLAIAWCMLIL
jgi:hypothetical protein